ncbi:MAG: hypothetical protein R3C32_12925 [Chloroflexota bacterium]
MAVVLRAWAPDGPMAWGHDAPPLPLALGLDVTEQARFLPEHLERLASRAGCRGGRDAAPRRQAAEPRGRFVADALAFYFRFHERFDGFRGAFVRPARARRRARPDAGDDPPVHGR